LNDPVKYPIAVENNFFNVMNIPDLITSKLPALKAYQHSIDAPGPPLVVLMQHQQAVAKVYL
jgi:hypothetical protein